MSIPGAREFITVKSSGVRRLGAVLAVGMLAVGCASTPDESVESSEPPPISSSFASSVAGQYVPITSANCALESMPAVELDRPLVKAWTAQALAIQPNSQIDVVRTGISTQGSRSTVMCGKLLVVTVSPPKHDDTTGHQQFLVDGLLSALDPATGTLLWRSKLPAGVTCDDAPVGGELPCVFHPREFSKTYCGYAAVTPEMARCRNDIAPGKVDAPGIVLYYYDLRNGSPRLEVHQDIDDIAVEQASMVTAVFRGNGGAGSVEVVGRSADNAKVAWTTSVPVKRLDGPSWSHWPQSELARVFSYGNGFVEVVAGDNQHFLLAANTGTVVTHLPARGSPGRRGVAFPDSQVAVIRENRVDIHDSSGRVRRSHPGVFNDITVNRRSADGTQSYTLIRVGNPLPELYFDLPTGRELPATSLMPLPGYDTTDRSWPKFTLGRITVIRNTSGYPTLGETVNYEAGVDTFTGKVLWVHRGPLGAFVGPVSGSVALVRLPLDRFRPDEVRAVDLRSGRILWSMSARGTGGVPAGQLDIENTRITKWDAP
ncbi:hypothetical protein [Gordonia sp. CPCC 205333]|uniref:hypothetical protein n=1 Tax=Gordonia sp. CPCC 205333 TaxID=3140790 RepID=UPI003AF3B1E5